MPFLHVAVVLLHHCAVTLRSAVAEPQVVGGRCPSAETALWTGICSRLAVVDFPNITPNTHIYLWTRKLGFDEYSSIVYVD